MPASDGCSSHRSAHAKAPAGDSLAGQLLQVLRLQIQSQIQPERHGWQRGLGLAAAIWGPVQGPQVFAAVAAMLDEMGRSRRSMFRFSNPDCPGCAAAMTAHETLFLQSFTLVLNDAPDKAQRTAFLLCEGNPCPGFLAAAERLAGVIPSPLSIPS